MSESPRERRSMALNYGRISQKTGDNVTVVLTPQERAFLFSVSSFASEFPHFLIEVEPEEKDDADTFLSAIVGKLS